MLFAHMYGVEEDPVVVKDDDDRFHYYHDFDGCDHNKCHKCQRITARELKATLENEILKNMLEALFDESLNNIAIKKY
jgi:hypothetical protein